MGGSTYTRRDACVAAKLAINDACSVAVITLYSAPFSRSAAAVTGSDSVVAPAVGAWGVARSAATGVSGAVTSVISESRISGAEDACSVTFGASYFY